MSSNRSTWFDEHPGPADLRAEFTQEGLARHDHSQQRAHLIGLVALMLVLVVPALLFAWRDVAGLPPILPIDSTASIDTDDARHLYATLELVGSLFGMFTGFALILRFYALGNRFHLLMGLGFFVTGVQDFIYGVFFFPYLFQNDAELATDLMPLTFAAGRFLMGLTLILAMVLPSWIPAAATARREMVRGAAIILGIVLLATTLLQLPVPTGLMQIPRPLQPIDFVAIVSLASAFVGYLARYHRTGEMLDWWTTASLSINVVGQLLMLLSPHTFDLYFFSALAYKALGYMVPLIGFFLYQIIVVLEYDRNRRDLITAREEALAASRVKSEFLANMSHEIRTPMNGVLGMTQRTLQTSLTNEQRDQLLAVYDSASSLLTLLDDILDFSKMEAGKFAIDPADFSLRACVDSAVRGLRTSAQDKGLELAVTIEPDLPDHYRGDARRLRQVLVNLIGNAIKFTRTGRIDVRVRRSLSVGTLSGRTLVRFEVIDTGIGIPRDKQEVIFEAFSQADGSTTRRFGGTGLGLAISSELVRMMGGRLGVESQPGQGSTFAFELLLPPAQAPPTFPAESILPGRTYQSQRPGTILVADDNEINRRLTTTALCDMGHRVLVACDGAEVIERYRDQSIDLILMDLQMPEVSGLEATKQIRRSEQGTGKHLPIIALTAHAMSDDRQRCLDAGMDDYLSKPVGDDALFAAVEKQLAGEPTPVGIFDDGPANPSRFDRARVIDRVRGDWALLRELVTIFDEQSSQLVQQWNDARTAGDLPALARSAHQLAGSAGNFQATRLIEQARQLERDAQQGLAPSADRWTALMSEWSQLRRELAEWISEQPTTEKLAGNKVGSVEPEVSRRTTSTLPPSSPA